MTEKQIYATISKLSPEEKLQLVNDFYRIQHTKERRLKSVGEFWFCTRKYNLIGAFYKDKSIFPQFCKMLMNSIPIVPIIPKRCWNGR